jgi:adenine-specific DNA-methyltransferase
LAELSDQERDEVVAAIRQGRTLPARYRASLFDDALETELIWPGKTSEVERVVLPFQSIEHIDEPRAETVIQPTLFSMDNLTGRQVGGWTNKLIWGDNKLILSSLANGPIRKQIDEAGGLKLVYIDPPFDVGADFSIEAEIGGEDVTKAPSVVEQVAYRDTWGHGANSYSAMMWERVQLIHNLLHSDGILLIHCDYRTTAIIRMIGDQIFGSENYRNEIVWSYRTGGAGRGSALPRKHDVIHVWAKNSERKINSLTERQYLDKPFMGSKVDGEGRNYVDTIMRDVLEGVINVVNDDNTVSTISVRPVLNLSSERLGYPTQKPEGLLQILLKVFAPDDGVIADFFCGSGTTVSVAEKLGCKWIAADLGRFAVHTTRKRLIGDQRALAAEDKPYRAFEILNLGSYERQYFAGVDLTLPEDQRQADSIQRKEQFLNLVLSAYGAQRSEQLPVFHGVKENAVVFVGALDAPVTQDELRKALSAAKSHGITRLDVLGFEFEMGIKPAMAEEAKEEGMTLTLRYIPNDVFDKRAIAKKQVKFFDVGYVEVQIRQEKSGPVEVSLTDFGVFYAQDDAESAAMGLSKGAERVVIDGGQVVRISKDKKGIISKEVLTKTWADWIDYWSVDFDFGSQKEIVVSEQDGKSLESWTGRYIFENQWQDFRTRAKRTIKTVSAPHSYDTPGEYKIAVKVVDVFGNDTTKVIKFRVK